MPQNKPLKIQWITVNGRQVPLVLPQTYSYADDDWKITSDRDPLPIVEYGTTEGGVIVPKRVSGEGHEITQLTGSLKEYLHEQDVEVTAMAYRNGKRFTFDSRVNYFTVGVLSNEDHDFSIFLNWMNEGGDIMEYRKEEFLSEGQRRLLSPVIKVKTKTIRVDIRNKSNDDMLYNVFFNIS